MSHNEFYRYISHPIEVQQIIERRIVRTTNPFVSGTWYTPSRYENPQGAQQYLSLPDEPTNRVGPIPIQKIRYFNIVQLRIVGPAYGQPGGGLEGCTTSIVYLFGLFNFSSGDFIL